MHNLGTRGAQHRGILRIKKQDTLYSVSCFLAEKAAAYTISNRARSTKLRDFSVFALANLVAGDATLAIIAGLLGMSREKWKKDVTFL